MACPCGTFVRRTVIRRIKADKTGGDHGFARMDTDLKEQKDGLRQKQDGMVD
jgi:hypothetical protein